MCRPITRFELELPEPAYGVVASLLGRLGAVTLETTGGGGHLRVVGHVPAAAVPDLASRLPDLTSGEGSLLTEHRPLRDR